MNKLNKFKEQMRHLLIQKPSYLALLHFWNYIKNIFLQKYLLNFIDQINYEVIDAASLVFGNYLVYDSNYRFFDLKEMDFVFWLTQLFLMNLTWLSRKTWEWFGSQSYIQNKRNQDVVLWCVIN